MSINILLWKLDDFTDWILTQDCKQLPIFILSCGSFFLSFPYNKEAWSGASYIHFTTWLHLKVHFPLCQTFTARLGRPIQGLAPMGLLMCWVFQEVNYGKWGKKMKWRKAVGGGSKEKMKGRPARRRNSKKLQEKETGKEGVRDTGHTWEIKE